MCKTALTSRGDPLAQAAQSSEGGTLPRGAHLDGRVSVVCVMVCMTGTTCQRTVCPRGGSRHLGEFQPDMLVAELVVPWTVGHIAVGVGQHWRELGGELTELSRQRCVPACRCSPGGRRWFLRELSWRRRRRTGERQRTVQSEAPALRYEVIVVLLPGGRGLRAGEWRPLSLWLSRGEAEVIVTVFLQEKSHRERERERERERI